MTWSSTIEASERNGEEYRMGKRKVATPALSALVMTLATITSSAAGATMAIRVEGTHCGPYATTVKKMPKATEDVEEVWVSFEKKEVWVRYGGRKVTVAQIARTSPRPATTGFQSR